VQLVVGIESLSSGQNQTRKHLWAAPLLTDVPQNVSLHADAPLELFLVELQDGVEGFVGEAAVAPEFYDA
jgi:hypothetical protein